MGCKVWKTRKCSPRKVWQLTNSQGIVGGKICPGKLLIVNWMFGPSGIVARGWGGRCPLNLTLSENFLPRLQNLRRLEIPHFGGI